MVMLTVDDTLLKMSNSSAAEDQLNELESTVEALAPEDFLAASSAISKRACELLKTIYDFAKSNENDPQAFGTFDNLILSQSSPSTLKRSRKKNNSSKIQQGYSQTEAPLPSLIVKEFDEDQIWEEIQLQNSYIYDPLVSAVSKVLVAQNRPAAQDGDDDESEDSAEELLKELESEQRLNRDEDDEEGDSDFLENDVTEKKRKANRIPVYSKSIVDDKFFNLAQMTEFVDKMDAEAEVGERDGDDEDEEDVIDMFEGGDEDDEGEENDYYYKDFFDPPPNSSAGDNLDAMVDDKDASTKKSVRFDVGDEASGSEADENDADHDAREREEIRSNLLGLKKLPLDDSEDSDSVDEATLSNFEKKRRRIEKSITDMEDEAMKPKPWQLTGEVTAETRPENSLLEEHLMYDHLIKQAPEITLKTTQKLEDIIKQRIKDKSWDDVVRKIKPIEDAHEFKKRLVLDAEKSKLSLAEIYEKEYVEKQKVSEVVVAEEKEPEEHKKIQTDLQKLFHKLDALSNYSYTPKPPSVEIKIVTNLPTISIEEVGPTAVTDSSLLAPQEILDPAKGEIKGHGERTKTDMKRERRLKKKKQHLKRLAQEEKARARGLGMTNVKLAESVVKKAKKDGKPDHVQQSKELKSSKAFFAKLQDQVTTHIDKVAKRKQEVEKSKSLSAKRFKL